MGLWAHQFKGFDKERGRRRARRAAALAVVAGIAVGVRGDPAEVSERDQQREQRERSRKPLTEIAYGAAWGTPWDGAQGQDPFATLAE